MPNFHTKYPNLSNGLRNLTIWIEDDEYVTIDLKDGEEVSLGHVGFEKSIERYLRDNEHQTNN